MVFYKLQANRLIWRVPTKFMYLNPMASAQITLAKGSLDACAKPSRRKATIFDNFKYCGAYHQY